MNLWDKTGTNATPLHSSYILFKPCLCGLLLIHIIFPFTNPAKIFAATWLSSSNNDVIFACLKANPCLLQSIDKQKQTPALDFFMRNNSIWLTPQADEWTKQVIMWNSCHVFNIYADNHQEHSSGQKGVKEFELESESGIYSALRKQHMLSFFVGEYSRFIQKWEKHFGQIQDCLIGVQFFSHMKHSF